MKKILILLVTMMLCACSPAEPMPLKDSFGQYKQEKIVYANKKNFIKKKDAYNAYLVYEINKDTCTFESDLKYQNIQYKKVELSKDVTFHTIIDEKFKTNVISVKFIVPLENEFSATFSFKFNMK